MRSARDIAGGCSRGRRLVVHHCLGRACAAPGIPPGIGLVADPGGIPFPAEGTRVRATYGCGHSLSAIAGEDSAPKRDVGGPSGDRSATGPTWA